MQQETLAANFTSPIAEGCFSFNDTSRHKYRSIFVISLNAKKDSMTFVSTVSRKAP